MRVLRATFPVALLLGGLARGGDVVCVPTAKTKEVTRTCYRLKVDHVCLTCKPACSGCDPCGKPREVRKLIKRFVKEQTVETRCEPVCPCAGESGVSPPASKSSTPPAPALPR